LSPRRRTIEDPEWDESLRERRDNPPPEVTQPLVGCEAFSSKRSQKTASSLQNNFTTERIKE
jgi:hypothetical protein